jgi:hypothetical protein
MNFRRTLPEIRCLSPPCTADSARLALKLSPVLPICPQGVKREEYEGHPDRSRHSRIPIRRSHLPRQMHPRRPRPLSTAPAARRPAASQCRCPTTAASHECSARLASAPPPNSAPTPRPHLQGPGRTKHAPRPVAQPVKPAEPRVVSALLRCLRAIHASGD